jgi:hypothetical protein
MFDRSLQVYGDVLLDVENKLSTMSIEHAHAVGGPSSPGSMLTLQIAVDLFKMHRQDQNFPQAALNALEDFINDYDAILANPEGHAELIREVKMECILATEYSPYIEVRANTESTDDPTMPSLTFRTLFIGTLFAGAGSFIDTLFTFRQPAIYVGSSVGQLLACKSLLVVLCIILTRLRPSGQVPR